MCGSVASWTLRSTISLESCQYFSAVCGWLAGWLAGLAGLAGWLAGRFFMNSYIFHDFSCYFINFFAKRRLRQRIDDILMWFFMIFLLFHDFSCFFINFSTKRRLRQRIDDIFNMIFMFFQYFSYFSRFVEHLFWQKAPAAKNRWHIY